MDNQKPPFVSFPTGSPNVLHNILHVEGVKFIPDKGINECVYEKEDCQILNIPWDEGSRDGGLGTERSEGRLVLGKSGTGW